jgi:hypothetical protein
MGYVMTCTSACCSLVVSLRDVWDETTCVSQRWCNGLGRTYSKRALRPKGSLTKVRKGARKQER